MLSQVIRRGVGYEQHLGARRRRALGRVREPGVLADVDAEPRAVQFEHERAVVGGEIALLVEHRVVRQVVLAVGALDPAVVQQRGGVEALTLALQRVADDHAQLRILEQLAREPLERRVGRCVECPAQQQVFGRISGERQLGRQQHVRALGHRAAGQFEHPSRIAVEITDGTVHLGDCNADV